MSYRQATNSPRNRRLLNVSQRSTCCRLTSSAAQVPQGTREITPSPPAGPLTFRGGRGPSSDPQAAGPRRARRRISAPTSLDTAHRWRRGSHHTGPLNPTAKTHFQAVSTQGEARAVGGGRGWGSAACPWWISTRSPDPHSADWTRRADCRRSPGPHLGQAAAGGGYWRPAPGGAGGAGGGTSRAVGPESPEGAGARGGMRPAAGCGPAARGGGTWWCRPGAPGRISAGAPGGCRPRRPPPRSRRSPWPPCSRGCCGTGDPGNRRPTPAAGGSSARSGQPCPPAPAGRVRLSPAGDPAGKGATGRSAAPSSRLGVRRANPWPPTWMPAAAARPPPPHRGRRRPSPPRRLAPPDMAALRHRPGRGARARRGAAPAPPLPPGPPYPTPRASRPAPAPRPAPRGGEAGLRGRWRREGRARRAARSGAARRGGAVRRWRRGEGGRR